MNSPTPVTLHGIIIPIGWGLNGSVSAVAIATDDERIINIIANATGRQLSALLRQRVEIEGILVQSLGKVKLQVESFRVDATAPFTSHP